MVLERYFILFIISGLTGCHNINHDSMASGLAASAICVSLLYMSSYVAILETFLL